MEIDEKKDVEVELMTASFICDPQQYTKTLASFEKQFPGMNIYKQVDAIQPTIVQRPVGIVSDGVKTQPEQKLMHLCIIYFTVPKKK